ncbi:hypothetical protein CN507_29185 [Bacillus cereus]|nr:hypothetical protein CN507_29185 [Bacillus cereus]
MQKLNYLRDRKVILNNNIHIWLVNLDNYREELKRFKGILTVEELSKARTFYSLCDQERYIVVRALIRIVLSLYLNLKPKEIVFVYNQYGKPFVLGKNKCSLSFNISHSKDMLAIAIANRSIGIDIEHIKHFNNIEEYIDIFLDMDLKNDLRLKTYEEKQEIFLRFWTIMESYVKAIGRGIIYPFSNKMKNIASLHTRVLVSSKMDFSTDVLFSFKKIEVTDYICTCSVLKSFDEFIIFRDDNLLEMY